MIHAQGLQCPECGQVEDHRADRGLFRGAHCPGCGAEDALCRYEPTFWNGGRVSRGDGVSDVSRPRDTVGAAHLVVAIGEAEHHRARGGINWAAGQVGTPVLIIDPEAEPGSEQIERGANRIWGAIDVIVPHWTSQVCEGLRAREAERQAETRFDQSLHRLDPWSMMRLYEYAETP